LSQTIKAAGQTIRLPDTPRQTVEKGLAVIADVRGISRQVGRDEMLALWNWLYLDTLNAMREETMTFKERKDAAMTLAICTEKALLLSGQPTQIIAGIHEHRHQLGDIAAKLARVAKVVDKPKAELAQFTPSEPAK